VIENISNYWARWLATKVPNNLYPSVDDQIEVFSYGIMVYLGALVKGASLVLIASLLGVLTPSLIITLTFSSFRIIAGGAHLKTFNLCLIVSLLQFIGGAFIVQRYQSWLYINTWYLFIFCIVSSVYIIIRYVPRDTANKPITEKLEIMKFKKWSFLYLLGWAIIMTVFLLLNLQLIVIASCFGLLMELFSISKIGNATYNFVMEPSQSK